MTQQAAQYEGAPTLPTKKVYYSGTDTIEPGYCLNYVDTATVGAADQKMAFGTQVTKPAAANLALFAGVAAASETGRVGPCWIKIHTPTSGVIVDAWTNAVMTKPATGIVFLVTADDDYGLIVDAAYAANETVAIACETVTTTTTQAIAKVKFL